MHSCKNPVGPTFLKVKFYLCTMSIHPFTFCKCTCAFAVVNKSISSAFMIRCNIKLKHLAAETERIKMSRVRLYRCEVKCCVSDFYLSACRTRCLKEMALWCSSYAWPLEGSTAEKTSTALGSEMKTTETKKNRCIAGWF